MVNGTTGTAMLYLKEIINKHIIVWHGTLLDVAIVQIGKDFEKGTTQSLLLIVITKRLYCYKNNKIVNQLHS